VSRPALALIDLAALQHNARLARTRHGGRQLAVVKANAYGHGAVACAKALRGTSEGFAVAFVDEALALRDADIGEPILVLEGAFDAEELRRAAATALWLVVHHEEQLRMLETATLPVGAVHAWLKIDTGMARVGFSASEARRAFERLRSCACVASVTLMTHFARADETGPATLRQIALFREATHGLEAPRSLCNSAGVLGWPQARSDWARPGLMLYGANPMTGTGGDGLQAVMTLSSQVFVQRTLATGEGIGYGAAFVAERPTRVGVVAMGYADGYPRTAPSGTPVFVDGQITRTLGRVSMDMLFVDLTQLPHAGLGSPVELWGPNVAVDDVARCAGALAYELLCNVKRVPLRHTDAALPHSWP
jgi:alanine racemase